MTRVLWIGDAGCTTGFATASHAIGDRLVSQYGHDVHCLAVNYKGDYWPTPMKLYVPTLREGRDTFGTTRFVELIGKINPEVIVTLHDPLVVLRWLFKNAHDPDTILGRWAPLISYLPIDGENYPPVTLRMPELVAGLSPLPGSNTIQPFMLPVVMSKHGNTAFPSAPLVYHGVETDYWVSPTVRPIEMPDGTKVKSKADARRVLQIPNDAILAVRVDRNSQRKNYADTITALAEVMRKEPKLHAWLHCKAEDSAGIDLNLFVSRFPDVADRFHWPGNLDTNQGWSTEALRAIYAAGDFFVTTSGGEGFGLTLGEAASMGLPIIAMNVSAIPEVVGPGGILLPPQRSYVPLSGQDNWLPDVDSFVWAIKELVNSRGKRRTFGQLARQHVVNTFSWDNAAGQFDQLITAVVQKASGSAAPGGTP